VDLVKETGTQHGLTSLYEMKQAVIRRKLFAEAIQTNFQTLRELAGTHDVICHFTENNHYLLIESIDDAEVKFFDPAWVERNHGMHTMWPEVFDKEWKGICLIVSEKPLELLASKHE
jgi:ABC-type bacteriocin/lantibiotic exporter with double-glycine peptidase domain